MFEIPVLVWIVLIAVLALIAGYGLGHNDGYKEGRAVGYRRGSKSVSQ